MSMADEAYRACQNAARAQAQATGKPVATDAVLTRHALAVDLTAGHVEQITRNLARRRGLGHIHRRPHRARPAHHHHRPSDR